MTRVALAAWLQAAPLALVLLALLPRAARCSSSWSASGTTTNTRSLPAFTLRNYAEIFEGCVDRSSPRPVHHAQDLSVDAEVLPAWSGLITLVLGFSIAYFLAFHVRSTTMQIALFAALHDPVLDLERDPHDLVDPAARPQRPGQPGAGAARARSTQPRRMAAVLRLLGGAGASCTSTRCS